MTPARLIKRLRHHQGGTAAAEMALVTPLLVILMFGSAELGNYFLDQHAVSKQVHSGARFASRLTLSDDFACPGEVYAADDADDQIIDVTRTGSTGGTATGRFPASFWTPCGGTGEAVTVTMRCVDADLYEGVYTGLGGDIPVVKVSANVAYPSLFGAVGFDAGELCLRAESETAVAGL